MTKNVSKNKRTLVMDPELVKSSTGTTLTVNPPLAVQPVIVPDKPWEGFMINFYTSVIDEGGKLRLWYNCRDKDRKFHVGYAESEDGIHWTKPALGLTEFEGNTANNIVSGTNFFAGNVFRDPHAASPDAAYVCISSVFKGFAPPAECAIYRYTSPDGLRWKRDAEPMLAFEADSQNVTLWDEKLGSYVLFLRGWDLHDPAGRARRVVRLELDALDRPTGIKPTGRGQTKEPERTPFIADEIPTVFACDALDPMHTDVYTSAVHPYGTQGEWLVGFPSMYRHDTESPHRNDGRTEIQFIASRDGKKWLRFDRAPYVAPGLDGSASANMIYIGAGLVERGDEVWHYGTIYRTTHGDEPARQKQQDGTICRFTQRIDGFVSLNFAPAGGRCLTKPVPVTGGKLKLNVDTGALGEARVGLLDENGHEILGFGVDECEPLRLNATGADIRWKEQADLASLLGRQVSLLIVATRTKLFSFRFE